MSINKSGLLLIDINLDNIHNIIKNLNNNIYYIFIDNYNIEYILKQISMYSFNFGGLLFLNYDLICVKSFLIMYFLMGY